MIIVGEKIVVSGNQIRHVQRWIKGWVKIPGAVFHFGHTGPETLVQVSIIKNLHIFHVAEQPKEKENL